MADFLLVWTAAGDRDSAVELLRSAVREHLAASGQVAGPVATAFWHLGEFGEGEEWQVLLKTTADRYAALQAHLVEHHPWQNPEVTAVPISEGSTPYLEWVTRATSAG
jgi:periplasmic divalent cation tolerance protein